MSTGAKYDKNQLHDMVRKAEKLEAQSLYLDALQIGRELVKTKPGWSMGHYCIGSAQCGLGLLDEADKNLQKAISRDPRQPGFFTRRAEVLNRMGHHAQAMDCVAKARALAPRDPRVLVVSTMVQWLGGDAQGAFGLIDAAVRGGINDPAVISVHGLISAEAGRLDEGIAELEQLLAEYDDGTRLPRLQHSEIRMHLAKLYDKAMRYAEAFESARRGGSLLQTGYNPQRITDTCDARLAAWSIERFPSIPNSRVKSDKPVYIIGMPRSGTSLVEQIIASHPRAYGAGELLESYLYSKELTEPDELISDRTAKAQQLQPAALDRVARKVLRAMEKAASLESGKDIVRITDKLPNNYELVGILSKLFEGARFVHCRRSPLDTCISCYLLDFVGERNHGYSYDLGNLAHQYRIYERYMRHWHTIKSIPILDVQYEDLIENPIEGSKRIIEFLGLEWDDACARPHETRRAVSTLSSDQVRKPVYTSSRERWRNYEKHIGVLIEALGTGTADGGA